MKRLLLPIVMSTVLFCGTAFAKTGEGMTIWFDTGGSAGDGYGTIGPTASSSWGIPATPPSAR